MLKAKTKSTILTISGYATSIAAPLIATATQFPVFVDKGTGATVSGSFLLVLLISAIPMLFYFKKLKESQRTLPKTNTSMLIWGIVLAVTVAFYQIADELIIISSAGAGGAVACKVFTLFAEKQAKASTAEQKTEQTKELINELLSSMQGE